MPFLTGAGDVVLRGNGPARWRLQSEVVYQGATHRFVVPEGFPTDFATIPGFLLWLIPRDGAHTLAAILHDWAVTDGIRSGVISPRDTDGLFRRCLRELGVPPLRRWLMYVGVRAGAMANPLRRPGSLRDVPLVAGTALLAAPIVAPGALLAVAGYAVYAVLELAAAAAAKARR